MSLRMPRRSTGSWCRAPTAQTSRCAKWGKGAEIIHCPSVIFIVPFEFVCCPPVLTLSTHTVHPDCICTPPKLFTSYLGPRRNLHEQNSAGPSTGSFLGVFLGISFELFCLSGQSDGPPLKGGDRKWMTGFWNVTNLEFFSTRVCLQWCDRSPQVVFRTWGHRFPFHLCGHTPWVWVGF